MRPSLHPHPCASAPASPSWHPLILGHPSSCPIPAPPSCYLLSLDPILTQLRELGEAGWGHAGCSHPLGCSGAGRDPADGVLSGAEGTRLCAALSFSWQCQVAETPGQCGVEEDGCPGPAGNGPQGAIPLPAAQHAAVCSQQTARGAGRDLRAVPASASPTAWQPLISPHQPCHWLQCKADGTNLLGSTCQGFHPKHTCWPCQAGHAKCLRGPSRWRSRHFPGQRRSASPLPNIYQQGPEEIDGVHSIWALPFTEPGTSRQVGWRISLHTDKHVQTLLPLHVSLCSQSRRPRLRTARLAEPSGAWGRGHKGMRHPRMVRAWVPAPKSCKQQRWKGAHRDAVTPATPIPCAVVDWGTPPLPRLAPLLAAARAVSACWSSLDRCAGDLGEVRASPALPQCAEPAACRSQPASLSCVTGEASCPVLGPAASTRDLAQSAVSCGAGVGWQGAGVVPCTVRRLMNKR